ncbi:MAG: hypothetical protein JKY37_01040, partial [Nannocystaceae bacterium]|nr:hypothetical protein [Nannocystaceae bacterium]
MENTEMRRRLSEVAAPPGGWPSLASELVEVRFFMERGNFADAFELLAILRQRYPLHPELEEFTESTRPTLAVDTDVHQVVDGVLANSAGLAGTSVGRRAAPHWNAPQAKGDPDNQTGSHTTVSATEFDDDRVALPRRRSAKQARRDHQPISAVPVVPIIPDSARIVAPKKKRKAKKKRLMTHRYERAEGALRDEPQEVAEQPVVASQVVEPEFEVVDAPQVVEPADEVVPMTAVDLAQEAAESLSVTEATPDLIEPGERERARAAGQFEVIEAAAEPMYRVASEDMGPVPSAVSPVDTQPLDPLDIEEVANLPDAAVPETVIELE